MAKAKTKFVKKAAKAATKRVTKKASTPLTFTEKVKAAWKRFFG